MQLRALKGNDFYALHQMMLYESFPDTPECFYKAKTFLDACLCYGKFNHKGCLQAAFIFGDIGKETAFLDVICRSHVKGKWLSRKVIHFIMETAFAYLGLNYIWVQPQNKTSLKLATAFGFSILPNKNDAQGVKLVFTKSMYQRSKFYKGNNYGFNF